MKYYKPLNATEEDAPYSNGNAHTGEQGSFPDARGFEASQREIVNAIKEAGLEPDADNYTQLTHAILKIAQNGLFSDIDGSLEINNGVLSVSSLVSMSKSENMIDNIIRPQKVRTILKINVNAPVTFSFDNSEIADLPDGVEVTFELHLNQTTVSDITFDPTPEWDGGEVPDLSEVKDYWLVFRTENKGASWKASLGSIFNAH